MLPNGNRCCGTAPFYQVTHCEWRGSRNFRRHTGKTVVPDGT